MEARPDGYSQRSRRLLAQGLEELAKGDHLQGSEKLWGAAAQMVKGVADSRGWLHDSHGSLFAVVNRLAQELNDPGVRTAFQLASSLHANFYEQWLTPEYVQDSVGTIEGFVARLEALYR